jgi:hypothetical protein
MTREEIRKALLEESLRPEEIRANDGKVFVVHGVEQWALGTGQSTIAIRNIASIGPSVARRRRRA